MERLDRLKENIDKNMELLEDDFWTNKNIPHIFYNDIMIVHIFYDEAFMCEVDPREYYNISNNDLENFFKYYNV